MKVLLDLGPGDKEDILKLLSVVVFGLLEGFNCCSLTALVRSICLCLSLYKLHLQVSYLVLGLLCPMNALHQMVGLPIILFI